MNTEDAVRLARAVRSPDGATLVRVISEQYDEAMRVLLFTREHLDTAQGKAQAFHQIMEMFTTAVKKADSLSDSEKNQL